jgi:hypothetical protein
VVVANRAEGADIEAGRAIGRMALQLSFEARESTVDGVADGDDAREGTVEAGCAPRVSLSIFPSTRRQRTEEDATLLGGTSDAATAAEGERRADLRTELHLRPE